MDSVGGLDQAIVLQWRRGRLILGLRREKYNRMAGNIRHSLFFSTRNCTIYVYGITQVTMV
jgi:hypothetical protein